MYVEDANYNGIKMIPFNLSPRNYLYAVARWFSLQTQCSDKNMDKVSFNAMESLFKRDCENFSDNAKRALKIYGADLDKVSKILESEYFLNWESYES